MVDIHSHIIPGIDDGSDSIATSLEMLRLAEKDGTKTIIATPHYFRGRFETDGEDVKNRLDELKSLAAENNIDIQILQGHEIYLDSEILKLYRAGAIKTLNGSRYMLLEFSFDKLEECTLDMLYELRLLGIVPVIAHPERYQCFIKRPTKINEFIDEGCLFQINSGSITGLFGKEVQKLAELFIKNGLANFIASDAHTTNKRKPGLSEALGYIDRINGGLKDILTKNVNNLIENGDISQLGQKIAEKRSVFNIFR